jgi:hypothetical protein
MNETAVTLANAILDALPFWNTCIVVLLAIAGLDAFVNVIKTVYDIVRK